MKCSKHESKIIDQKKLFIFIMNVNLPLFKNKQTYFRRFLVSRSGAYSDFHKNSSKPAYLFKKPLFVIA